MLLQGDLQGKVFAATSANPVVNLLLQGVEVDIVGHYAVVLLLKFLREQDQLHCQQLEDVKEVEVLLVDIRLKAMAFGPEAV